MMVRNPELVFDVLEISHVPCVLSPYKISPLFFLLLLATGNCLSSLEGRTGWAGMMAVEEQEFHTTDSLPKKIHLSSLSFMHTASKLYTYKSMCTYY